jgi:hypothetical protein
VHAYTLDAGSEDFAVDLRSSCHIVLLTGSYFATFSNRLTGCLDDRHISSIDDIRVRAFFRWWSVTGTGDLVSLCGIELCADVKLHNDELHSFKQQSGIALKAYVAIICFKCFSCFRGILQGFYMDVVKVDRVVAYVAMVVHLCCKRLFSMYHLFFRHILQVCLSECCIYFTHMLQMIYLDVAYVLQWIS